MSKDEIKTAVEKLLEINDVIKQLDDSLRQAAINVLIPLHFPSAHGAQKPASPSVQVQGDAKAATAPDNSDLGAFLESFEQSKPADSVLMLVAWLYSHYGAYSITAREIQELGDSCGLILPKRPDNTMRQAKNDGKTLFTQQGKGWRLTVSGELYIKNKFAVKKGNKPLPSE